MTMQAAEAVACPVCDGACAALPPVDFNKSCEELRGKMLPRSGISVRYLACTDCGFCFAPDLHRWSHEELAGKVYNDAYTAIDPDWEDVRPRNNAHVLSEAFGDRPPPIRHLDYGGGNGLLARILAAKGWSSLSYDPYVDRGMRLADLGKFDLVTAFEVFEHVQDVQALVADLAALLVEDGVVLFSTLISDGNIVPGQPLTWWYAAPRNGHISLYSSRSLAFLGAAAGFSFGSLQDNLHAFWKSVPPWAVHLLPQA
jgi:SAM-dependent methyltransferase